jgi:hypothetical protein
MKTFLFLFLTLLVFTHAPLHAQNGPPAHAGGKGLHAALHSGDDLAALDQFLSMSDAELDQLQSAIARVRAMSPAEREAFRQKMIAYRQLPEGERQQVQQRWGWQSEQDRSDWSIMMRSKTEPERSAIQADVQSQPSDQRAARKHAILETWRAANNQP